MTAPLPPLSYTPSEDDPLRTVEYVAKVVSYGEDTVRRWLREGTSLRGIKVAGEWRVPHSELVRFINEEYGDAA